MNNQFDKGQAVNLIRKVIEAKRNLEDFMREHLSSLDKKQESKLYMLSLNSEKADDALVRYAYDPVAQQELLALYESIIETYKAQVRAGTATRLPKSILDSDVAFNEWIRNPTISGDKFAKHNRAFVKFMTGYDINFKHALIRVN